MYDFLYGLKECPRCMGADGFSIHTYIHALKRYNWEEKTLGSDVIEVERRAIHCSCCGVILEDELNEMERAIDGDNKT